MNYLQINSFHKVLSEAEQKLPHILYGDTDSLFVLLDKLLISKYAEKYNIDFNNASLELTNYATKDVENKLDEETIKNILDLVFNISSELDDVVADFIKYFVKIFNVKIDPTIHFEFEYLASRFFMVAGKTYFAKEIGEKSLIQKNIGVKKSDPKLTKQFLQELFILILKHVSLKELTLFIHKWAKIFVEHANKFSWHVGIPITITKPFNEYATISKHLKSVLNWNAYAFYLENELNIENIPKFKPGSRGFMFDVKANTFTRNIKLVEYIKQYYRHIHDKFNPKVKFNTKELTYITLPYEIYEREDIMEIIINNFKIDLDELFRLAFCSYLNRVLQFEVKPNIHNIINYKEEDLKNMSDVELNKILIT